MMVDMAIVLAAAAPAPGQGNPLQMFVPLIIIFGIFYFMLIRPQQRKEKERRTMVDNLKTGARVVFGGGFLGTVTNVKDTTFVIKIADGVKVEVVRGSVTQVLEKGDKAEPEVAEKK